jgi:hypothetical protein
MTRGRRSVILALLLLALGAGLLAYKLGWDPGGGPQPSPAPVHLY